MNRFLKIKKIDKGFFSVELLIVLFIAAGFVISGYQLYSSVLNASLSGKSDITASNIANDYMERYRYRASTPCNEKTIIDDMPVVSSVSSNLRNPRVTVKISCPVQGVSSFLKNGVSSKIDSVVTYDDGRKTSTSKIVNNKVVIKQIASKYDFVVALDTAGQVYTWGANNYGQLGNGTTGTANNSSIPVSVISSTGVLAGKYIKKVAVGQYHVLALDSEGDVYAWGYGNAGRLGDGGSTNQSAPVKASTLTVKARDITASASTSAAVGEDGYVYTWGLGTSGQLGNGGVVSSITPVQVTVPGGVKEIQGGSNHFLVVNSSGLVYGWGSKANYVLGDGVDTGNSPSPTQIAGLSGVSKIAAGTSHNLAVTSGNVLYAWGLGSSGRLGEGLITDRTTPTNISSTTNFGTSSLAGKTISYIEVGGTSSYAIDSSGVVHSWGANASGQLGISPIGTTSAGYKAREVDTKGTPLEGRKITLMAAGTTNAIALDEDGNVYSWGGNGSGQLGNRTSGTTTNTPVAGDVQNGASITKITNGYYHSIALMSDGNLYGWGRNSNGGSVGNGSSIDVNFPVPVSTAGTPMASKTIKDVAANGYHSLALDTDGGLYSWGLGTSGQLGDGSKVSRNKPVAVNVAGTPLEGKTNTITQLAVGEFNSMVLTSDGKVYSWGRGTNGLLGNGTIVDMSTPAPVEVATTGTPMAGKTIVQIALSGTNAYALDSLGAVYSWGCTASGALGNGTTTGSTTSTSCTAGVEAKPVAVNTVGTPMAGKVIVEIGAGSSFAIARTQVGETYGWGSNGSSRLGDGTTTNRSLPIRIPVWLQKLAVGYTMTAGLGTDGYLYSWGANNYYQQANGTTANVTTPTARAPFTARAIDKISTGAYNVFVLDYGKNLYGWGYNTYGDLGIGNAVTPQQTPRPLTRIQYDNVW